MFLPQAAAIHDTKIIQPQLANVVATALVAKPQAQFPNMTANYNKMLVIKANEAKALIDAQRAAQDAANALAAQQTRYIAPRAVAAPSGSCATWIAEAGVTDVANAMIVINRESGCNPNAVNRSSGACGIGQQLPCGKWPHVWNDPVGSIIDMQAYVFGRYGSWAGAVAQENSAGWY